jgi:hypothetical protein
MSNQAGQQATATCKQCANQTKYETPVVFSSVDITRMMSTPCAACGTTSAQLTLAPMPLATPRQD